MPRASLWEPNCLAPISAAQLKLTNESWLIMQVTYRRDENGQHADLTLMPKDALAPEPVALNPIPPLVRDVEANNPTKPQSSDLNLPSDAGRNTGSTFA